MKNVIGKSGMVLIFLSATLLSACAGESAGELLSGSLSKPVSELGFLGTVEGISDVAWNIDGRMITLSDDTKLESELRIGDTVRVEVELDAGGFLNAMVIEPSSSDLFVIGSEVEFFGVVAEITPTMWTIGSFEVAVHPGTEIKGLIQVGDLVKVHAAIGEGGSLSAREIELANDDDDRDEKHAQDEVEFVGTVEAISDSEWTVDGRTVMVTSGTEIKDEIVIGDLVKVEAYEDGDGNLIAHEIELTDDDDLDSDFDNDLDEMDDYDSDDDEDHDEDNHDEDHDEDDEHDEDHDEHDGDDD